MALLLDKICGEKHMIQWLRFSVMVYETIVDSFSRTFA